MLSISLLAMALMSPAFSQTNSGTPIKFENGPPPVPAGPPQPPVNVNAVTFDWSSHEGQGVLLAATGNANAFLGHAFYPGSQTLSANLAKNGDKCAGVGDPILPQNGTKVEQYTDFAVPIEMGLKYERFYNSLVPGYRQWTDSFSYWLDTSCQLTGGDPNTGVCRQLTAYEPDGITMVFQGGQGTPATFTENNGAGVATLTHNADGSFIVHDEQGLTEVYDTNGNIQSVVDASGVGWTFSSGRVTHTNGQYITISSQVNSDSTVTKTITDPAGNKYTYTYGAELISATLPGSPSTTISYKYLANQDLLTEVDYNGAPYSYTNYTNVNSGSTWGLASGTYLADNSKNTSIVYGTDSSGNHTATITNPLGNVRTNVYGGPNGKISSTSVDAVQDCGSTTSSTSYDTNGNPSQTVDNNGNVHTYHYAANGQLQSETEAYGTSLARTTDYTWDPDVQVNRLLSATVEGWKKTVYSYNAQNRIASVSVTNLSSTGAQNQTLTTTYGYSLYANGMVHTISVTHPSPNGSDVDTYTYDAMGNLASYTNGLGQTTTYGNYNGLGEVGHVVGPNADVTDYSYDARGRMVTRTTYPNGTAASWSYAYDGFGLLASVSAPDGEVTTWNRDPEMRVTSMTHNDKDGTSTEAYGYDANDDVTSKTVSRNGTVTYSTSTTYDALGRPYQTHGNHGQQLTYSYDGNGNVLSVSDATGHVTSYQYDALDRVIQKTESGGASPSIPTGVPAVSSPANSTDGSYTLSWNAIGGATFYELQEEFNGGSWTTVQNNSSLGWSASGKANGTYGYRVHACDVTGCGAWSSVATVTVLYPPGTPSLSVPANNNTGGYTVSWSAVATATGYNLQEQVNGGSWTTVQSNSATNWGAAGKGNGTYGYEVQACNASGCSAWSPVGSVAVLLPPASAPSLSAPSSNASGAYTVSWTSVATATSYNLEEQINGGSWTTVQSNSATSWGAAGQSDGTYAYQVQACNSSGCSAWSSVATTTVLFPPGSPPSVSSPSTSTTGSYTVSWSTIANATSYNLQEQVNGGAWSTVQSSSATSWNASGQGNGSYGYQVQSCNSGGCSGWSSVSTTTVLHPPGSAPTLSAPGSSTNGSYTVSWTGVATATSYNLQEQVNGGGWTTVQSGASTSWSTSGRGDATYGYQVQACNSSGCGPWSGVGSTTVLLPPGTPSLSVPASNGSGSYTVSWSGVATATSYNLQEQVNGGGWTTVQSGASTSWSTSGRGDATYGYHVQACNSSGCGPWSGVASTTVLLPPSSAPALSVPGTNGNGSYTVSWSGVSTASSYTLQEQVNGGGWTTVQANGNTSWNASGKGTATYGYRVQACNASGCGPWSGTDSITVTIPVPITINGQSYSTSSSPGSTGGASAAIGFEIVGGKTWEVFTSNQHVANTLVTSGGVPSGAATVQYTWTEVGLANGANLSGGTVSNGASTPTAVSSNPSSNYYVSMAKNSSNVIGLTYHVTVTFYNAAGANISSSTCTMTATVVGTM
ncbi:RHS repeat protein [Dyella ginsengisoli]|uniref:RHS repeat protein n=1 Tax=Dyella ginsengisoli TaxID=363848 RepID=UPI000A04D8F1|nr:RHS repeat protein [Dyella ginsengisoli]